MHCHVKASGMTGSLVEHFYHVLRQTPTYLNAATMAVYEPTPSESWAHLLAYLALPYSMMFFQAEDTSIVLVRKASWFSLLQLGHVW